MCNKCLFLVLVILLSGCGRNDLAPVAIKVDGNGDIVGQEHLGPGEPTFGTTEPTASNPTIYVVKDGETLFDIANRFNLDPMVLARVNGIAYPYKVHAGQRLRIPGSFSAEEVASASPIVTAEPPVSSEKEKKITDDDDDKSSSNIDDDFSAMLTAVSAGSTTTVPSKSTSANLKRDSFSDQEEELSKPKIKAKIESKKSEELKSAPKEEKKVVVESGAGWVAPVKGDIISSYGDIVDGDANDGIDIRAAKGTPVKAASGGDVIFSGEGNNLSPSFGKTVLISHGNNVVSSYTHLDSINVKNGEKVKTGQVIGTVGQTGDVKEPQLHFEITKGDDANSVNPSKYVKF